MELLKENNQKTKRQSGLEMLRIFCMIMIVGIHALAQENFWFTTSTDLELAFMNLFASLMSPAVNIFVLITGYFMVTSRFKPKKLISLWGQVVFYAITLFFMSRLFDKNVEFTIEYIFPLITGRYWFFSTYFLLYISAPLLNKILNNSSQKELYITIAAIFVITYIASKFYVGEYISIGVGFSWLWFMMLYLIGGTIMLYPPKIARWVFAITYVVSVSIVFFDFYIPKGIYIICLLSNSNAYATPFVLLASISMFMLFKDWSVGNKPLEKVILSLSSASFGVYLLDRSPIRHIIFKDILQMQNFFGKPYSVLMVIAFCAIIYLITYVFNFLWIGFKKLVELIIRKAHKSKIIQSQQETPHTAEEKTVATNNETAVESK